MFSCMHLTLVCILLTHISFFRLELFPECQAWFSIVYTWVLYLKGSTSQTKSLVFLPRANLYLKQVNSSVLTGTSTGICDFLQVGLATAICATVTWNVYFQYLLQWILNSDLSLLLSDSKFIKSWDCLLVISESPGPNSLHSWFSSSPSFPNILITLQKKITQFVQFIQRVTCLENSCYFSSS